MMQLFMICSCLVVAHAFNFGARIIAPVRQHALSMIDTATLVDQKLSMAKRQIEPEKTGLDWLKSALEKAENQENDAKAKNKKTGPPLYEPGPLPQKLIAASAYLIPIIDTADMGKYMFAAYPDIGTAFTTALGPLAAVYNGVPFLSFAVFFLMSYISRAPSFPVEVRFHFAQAFMISLVQFVPSLLFGVMEKAGVPGMAVLYNSVFIWVMVSCITMQSLILLEPLAGTKNPVHYNVLAWSLRFMNYSKDLSPRRK